MIWIVGSILGVFIALCVVLARISDAYRVRVMTCVIRPEQLADVTSAMRRENLMMGMTVINVRGFGRQAGDTGKKDHPVQASVIRFLPKLKLEILVRKHDVDRMIDVVAAALHTGQIGDGKIVVYDAVSAMRIRTGEKGIDAL